MSCSIYIFAGGGTGGHLYPGIAVAEELLGLRPEAKVVFACSSREIDRRILDPLPYAAAPQPIRPLPRKPRDVLPFLLAWRRSAKLARDMIRDLEPAAVLGLGGFAAAPIITQAHKASVRAGLLNPDAVPGKANRHLARRAEAIFTQFESTAEHFPPSVRGRISRAGCPVRRSIQAADRQDALRHFGLRADRKTLLVLGGSLGAESINSAFAALARRFAEFADTWQALHVTGPAKAGPPRAAEGRRALMIRSLEYCDRMDLAYAAADIALCRAGAVTVAELAAAGTPAVLVPYPYHADEHQRHNARPLAEAGAARICDDLIKVEDNARSLGGALVPILRDASVLRAMTAAAGGLGTPRAAETVAGWLAG